MKALKEPIERSTIIDKCEGCNHVNADGDANYCSIYTSPAWKWEMGNCNFGTHIKREVAKAGFINPLKLAKMRARGEA